MKKIGIIACGLAFLWGGCDYLDIVPEDDVKSIETIFEQRSQVDGWVATCYRNIPGLTTLTGNVAYTGADELVGNDVHRYVGGMIGTIDGFKIGDGLQQVLHPINDSWTNKSYYATIRYCNTFFENIGNTLNMEQEEKELWTAEVKAVKAFYYFQMVRKYGPIILLPQTIGIEESINDMKRPRVHVDTCFKEIVRLLDEAIEVLPLRAEKEAMRQGYFHKESALALKAQVLVYQASPLFNGNPSYASSRNRKGELLFSATPDREKWRRAAEACDEAIKVCEDAGWGLTKGYTGKATSLLNTMMDIEQSVQAPGSVSKEIVFQTKTIYSNIASPNYFFAHTLPYFCNATILNNPPSDGSMSPSMKMVEMYYTKNGLPIDMDREWKYEERYTMGQVTDVTTYERVIPANTGVLKLHLDREPRFYACIAADRLYWRGAVVNQSNEMKEPKIITARKGEEFGTNLESLQSYMNQNRSGYWLMKHIYTDLLCNNYNKQIEGKGDLPKPLIRMAQLYLWASEAWNEYLETPDDRVYAGIDTVRARAGIPDVKEAWSQHSTNPALATTQAGMRQIIRRETSIELAFEGQRFWDLRRWLEAEKELNEPLTGWNVVAADADGFYNNYQGPVVVWEKRGFLAPRDYFFPISSEVVQVSGVVQNPGW